GREAVVDRLPGARWNLVIVERSENVLWIAAVHATSLAVQHIHIYEMRPRIDFVVRPETAAAANHLAAGADFCVGPDFVGIDGALGERMTDLESAQHDFDQISVALLERRRHGPQRGRQWTVDRAALFDAENVHAQSAFQEVLVTPDDPGLTANGGDPGVRRREKVIVDKSRAGVGRIEEVGAEIPGLIQRHVAAGATRHRLLRIIKAPGAMARDAAQE